MAFLFVQKIYSFQRLLSWFAGNMKGKERTSPKEPVVTFSLEVRESTSEQIEAGKRLFKNLVTRAQKKVEEWKA